LTEVTQRGAYSEFSQFTAVYFWLFALAKKFQNFCEATVTGPAGRSALPGGRKPRAIATSRKLPA